MDQANRDRIRATSHLIEVVERAEKDGIAAMTARYDEAKAIADQAASTLNILLVGIGGSMAYGVTSSSTAA